MGNLNLNSIMHKIKTARERLGYSFQDLADKTGMSKSTLQRYETGGIKNIPIDKLKILSSALEVDPAYLLGWDNLKEIPTSENEGGVDERLKLFRSLSPEKQKIALDYMRFLADQEKSQK